METDLIVYIRCSCCKSWNGLPFSVRSQSVMRSRPRGWTEEESLMNTCPFDWIALKKVIQRLGSSFLPLITHWHNEKNTHFFINYKPAPPQLHWVVYVVLIVTEASVVSLMHCKAKHRLLPVDGSPMHDNWTRLGAVSEAVGSESAFLDNTSVHLNGYSIKFHSYSIWIFNSNFIQTG